MVKRCDAGDHVLSNGVCVWVKPAPAQCVKAEREREWNEWVTKWRVTKPFRHYHSSRTKSDESLGQSQFLQFHLPNLNPSLSLARSLALCFFISFHFFTSIVIVDLRSCCFSRFDPYISLCRCDLRSCEILLPRLRSSCDSASLSNQVFYSFGLCLVWFPKIENKKNITIRFIVCWGIRCHCVAWIFIG